MSKDVIIIGAGGHAKVIADIVLKNGDNLLGYLDDNKGIGETVLSYSVLGNVTDILEYQNTAEFVIGIGNNSIRKTIADKYEVKWYTAIHPSATIAIDVKIGMGTVIMANVVINTSARIGKHCIVNTCAIVEHDNVIEDYVHLSPGVALGGMVNVGLCTHIGIGATVRNNINITRFCIIGAGAVVVKNIEQTGTYIGVPARRVIK